MSLILPRSGILRPPPVAGGGGGYSPLGDVVSSCEYDLDATVDDSYDGSSQTWANLEGSPASGASQTDYDFWLGADNTSSTDDPTFNGTAGDADAYWTGDGANKFFEAKSMTSWIKSVHKTTGGSDFTFVFAIKVSDGATQNHPYIGTSSGATVQGLRAFHDTTEELKLFQRGDSGAANDSSSEVRVTGDTFHVVGIGHSHSSNESYYYLSGSRTATSHTFNTTTTDGDQFRLAFMPNSIEWPADDARFIAASAFNAVLTIGEFNSVEAEYESRHDRTY